MEGGRANWAHAEWYTRVMLPMTKHVSREIHHQHCLVFQPAPAALAIIVVSSVQLIRISHESSGNTSHVFFVYNAHLFNAIPCD